MKAVFITALLLCLMTNSASAAERIFYFRESKLARESFFNYPSYIDIFAPQTYSFKTDGKLVGEVAPELLAFARRHHIRVMPVVTNNGFSQTSLRTLLDDPVKQDAAIVALIIEAKKQKFWGWQIDFEQMILADRDLYSVFINKLSSSLRGAGLIASVAVVAQISENPADYPNDLWPKLIGAYDYAALAAGADFITVMAYDDPISTGPVARNSWLKQVINYSLSQIPAKKLSLGLGLYYWKWDDTTGKRVGIGGAEGINNTLEKHAVRRGYSDVDEASFLHYYNQAKPYTLWYESGRSLRVKLALINHYHLRGFSAWALGLELPAIYPVLKEVL